MPRKEEYQKRKAHYREYGRNYSRIWRGAGGKVSSREYMREYMTRYRQTPNAKKMILAHNTVNNLIAAGGLKREVCIIDSCSSIGEAHHEDYSKPLEIVWLCKIHHENHHSEINI